MKKIIFLILLTLLTGCTNYNDISNIAVVSTITIDKIDEQYDIKIKVLSSNQKNEENIYNETCPSINECFDKLNNQLTKRLYLTHLDLLVLDNSLNKDDYNNIMNFFLSQKTSRNSFTTVITDNINEKIFDYDTKDINNMLDLSITTTGLVNKVTFDEIIKNILNYKLSYIPYLENKDNLEIKGYKSIYEDNKILTEKESLAINLIQNNIKETTILLNDETYKLEGCTTLNSVDNNIININLTCNYKGKKEDKEKLTNYIKTILLDFIYNNKDNYFDYLIYKFEGKYKEEKEYKVKISLNYLETTGGEIFD